MPDLNESETDHMVKVPESNWYKITLECGDAVYTRVRLRYEKPGRQYHNIRCPQCDLRNSKNEGPAPLSWSQVSKVEAVTDEHVSDVQSGLSYVVSHRIMRLDYGGGPNGNPFPYSSADRDY